MFAINFLFLLFLYSVTANLADDIHVEGVGPEKIFYDLDEAEDIFKEFIETYEKEYETDTEYSTRFEIFKNTLRDINERNKESDEEVYGITEFADLTAEEFVREHTGLKDGASLNITADDGIESRQYMRILNVPDHLDWRAKGVVTPVRDQLQCQSCWSFSAVGCVESQYAIKHGVLLTLSEQQLVDCYKESCQQGDWPHHAMNVAASMGGFMSGKDYPYKGVVGKCKFQEDKVVVKLNGGLVFVVKDEELLKKLVFNFGPLSIGIYASSGFSQYKGGISSASCLGCTPQIPINHAVLLVGYGTSNGIPYWIIKNSASRRWGEQGYMRLKRGENACNILSYVAYAHGV